MAEVAQMNLYTFIDGVSVSEALRPRYVRPETNRVLTSGDPIVPESIFRDSFSISARG